MADAQNNQKNQQQDLNQILKVRREKLAALQEAGKDPFRHVKYDVTAHSKDIVEGFEELEGKTVSIAGRIMFKRVMGKASFCNVQDLKGSIQVYVARDNIGEEPYADFKKYDVGDIIGVKGEVFKTKTGEISVHASEVELLTKSLQVLPEKFHGLTNTDQRYRQRYVDLIMNQDVIWMDRALWKWRLPCWLQMPAALLQDPSRRITMRWMRMLSCVFPWSCI